MIDRPENAGILAYLTSPERLARSASAAKNVPLCRPGDVPRAYETLGTHPDLVMRLWDELGGRLPVDCRFVVYGVPALAHPDTGILFGYAGGTLTYALRLPPAEFAEAMSLGAKRIFDYPPIPSLGIPAKALNVGTFGDGWVLGNWFSQEASWVKAAFESAGGT